MKDLLEKLDLHPFSMSGHCNLMDTQRLPDFVMNMRLAHFFGCDYIVSSIGEAHLADNAKASNELLAQNTGKPLKTIEKDVERDHYLSADEALSYGLIDEIIAPRR